MDILFTVHYGGSFHKTQSNLVYKEGKCSCVFMNLSNISKSAIVLEIVKTGHDESSIKEIYFAYPSLPLDKGLVLLVEDCLELQNLVRETYFANIYVVSEQLTEVQVNSMEIEREQHEGRDYTALGDNDDDDDNGSYEDNSDYDDDDVIESKILAKLMKDKVVSSKENGEIAIVSESMCNDECDEDILYQDSDNADSPPEDSDEETPLADGQRKARIKKRSGMFRHNGEMELKVGAQFLDKKHFKHVLDDYRIRKGYAVKIKRSSKTRVQAVCIETGCSWTCWASPLQKENTWVLKTMSLTHQCIPFSFQKGRRHMSSDWLAKTYEQQFRDVPHTKIRELKTKADRELDMKLTKTMCANARKKAMVSIVGDYKGQFGSLRSYCVEVLLQNPGSTAKIRTTLNERGEGVFKQMYICLESLKKGFLEGCRRVISLDGCFLKGPWAGQLLAAVGRDANNQMYPVAWGVAESESTESWRWFIHLLQADLNIGDGEGWTIISDQQKGLINAVNFYLPKVEHRMCARHVYANLRKYWKGLQYRDIFWRVAKSSNEPHFNFYKTQFQNLDGDAWEFIEKKDPRHFCRRFFHTAAKCDSVDNNMAEVFNATIVEARFKPIVTMLCEIQTKTMTRIARRHTWALTLNNTVSPRILTKLQKHQEKSTRWCAHVAGNGYWSVQHGLEAFTVSLNNMTCTCGSWQLSGVPCVHSIAVFRDNGINAHSYVHDCYSPEHLRNTYAHSIHPINGIDMWSEAPHGVPVVAPFFKLKMKGLRTKRIPEVGEVKSTTSGRVSRAGSAKHCSNCKQPGHNKKGCKRPQQHNMGSHQLASQEVSSNQMPSQPIRSHQMPIQMPSNLMGSQQIPIQMPSNLMGSQQMPSQMPSQQMGSQQMPSQMPSNPMASPRMPCQQSEHIPTQHSQTIFENMCLQKIRYKSRSCQSQ